MSEVFAGLATALVTPFTEDGVDKTLLRILIDRQIEAGADALVVLGTTGEPCTMTDREKEQTIAWSVEAAAGRVPVIAGVGSNDTRVAEKNAETAQRLGTDALLAVTPYYNKCTQAGLIDYFVSIAEAGKLPTILYNVPSRTGVNLLPETAAVVCAHPLICGLKEAAADIVQLSEAARLLEGRACVYSGNDDMCLPALSVGAKGLISVTSNVAPKMTAGMIRAWMAGNPQESLVLFRKLARLNRLMFSEVSPIPCKAALRLMGFGTGRVRPPLTGLTAVNERLMREELENLELIC